MAFTTTDQPEGIPPNRRTPVVRNRRRNGWVNQGSRIKSRHRRWRPTPAAAGRDRCEAVAHIPVIEAHLTEAPYIGVGFCTVGHRRHRARCAPADRRHTPVWACTLAVAALALVGYLLSHTIGLPQIGGDIGNWGEPPGIVAIVCEAIMLLGATGIRSLYRPEQPGRTVRDHAPPSPQPGTEPRQQDPVADTSTTACT